jgi:uncharacterized protein
MSWSAGPVAQFTEFVAPAQATPQLWRVGMALLLAAAGWGATTLLLWRMVEASGPKAFLVAFLFGFSGMIVGLGVALALLHRRSLGSVLGPGEFRVDHFLMGASVVFVVTAIYAMQVQGIADAPPAQSPATWLVWAPVAVVAIFGQACAEEMVFRGYLQQQLAARFRARAVWFIAPAALFGALHWRADLGTNATMAAGAAVLMGLVYGDVAARLGNISASIGLHFANNVMALLIVAPEGPMGALALFPSSVDPGPSGEFRAGLFVNVGVTLGVWAVWRGVLDWRSRTLQSRGSGSIKGRPPAEQDRQSR